jgi:UDP-N-acetylglucosamine 2-epimerase
LQEEAATLGTPALVLRRETEWMEYIAAGINTLVGVDEDEIVCRARELLGSAEQLADARRAGRYVQSGAAQRIFMVLQQSPGGASPAARLPSRQGLPAGVP